MVREGERVEDADGARGTVRYVGPVATSKDASAVYYGTAHMLLMRVASLLRLLR